MGNRSGGLSPDGNAWDYFPFEMSHMRAYRWGEDGIIGISDNHQRLCFAPAFWNGQDRILKEKFYGLNGHEGNHGEDVKEVWYHLDNVPSHAYMKALYKYPQRAFPYDELRAENARRGRDRPNTNSSTPASSPTTHTSTSSSSTPRRRPKTSSSASTTNRAKDARRCTCCRRCGFATSGRGARGARRPSIAKAGARLMVVAATIRRSANAGCVRRQRRTCIFTENETNYERAFGVKSPRPFVKDAFRRLPDQQRPQRDQSRTHGTKAAFHYVARHRPRRDRDDPLAARKQRRRRRLDGHAFDDSLSRARRRGGPVLRRPACPTSCDAQDRTIQRRAFAGLLWSKQCYNYVIRDWLKGDPLMPAPPAEPSARPQLDWTHLYNEEVISMPDDWEYPWYAAWDLGFHVIPFALIDPEFAKRQLVTLTREALHASQRTAAGLRVGVRRRQPAGARVGRVPHLQDRSEAPRRRRRLTFLERVFQKLLLNFTWWVNRKDVAGRNVFQGGFLGLDNIGVFDRSAKLPTGGYLAQADGTAWMGVYSLNMLAIAIELARHDTVYEHLANKFFEHFLYIADAINAERDDDAGLWDPQDEFYYDQLYLPTGERIPLKVRSAVGMIPIFAVETLDPDTLERLPLLKERVEWFIANRPELAENVARIDVGGMREAPAAGDRQPRSPAHILRRLFAEEEFFSPHGLRALSKIPSSEPLRAQRRRRELSRRLRARRIDQRDVRRQLELARPDVVSAQLPAHRVAAEVPPLPR